MKRFYKTLLMLLVFTAASAASAQAQERAVYCSQSDASCSVGFGSLWMDVGSFAVAGFAQQTLGTELGLSERGTRAGGPDVADVSASFGTLSGQLSDVLQAPQTTVGDSTGLVFEGMATPVPESHTYALILAGLGVVGFMARRRSGDRAGA